MSTGKISKAFIVGLIVVLFQLTQVIKMELLNSLQSFTMLSAGFVWTQQQSIGINKNNNPEIDCSSLGKKEDLIDDNQDTAFFSHSVTTRIQINSPFFERQSIVMERPTQDNTVIAFIAMGPYHTFLVHRAIRSIRASGEFHGYIMIMTDIHGWDHLSWSLDGSDSKVILIKGHDRHLNPIHAAPSIEGNNNSGNTNQTAPQGRPFQRTDMIYKRFKTYLLEYIAENDTLNRQMEYCLYLDIDNVIFHPMQRLLDDYYYRFATTYQQVIEKDTKRLMKRVHRHNKARIAISATNNSDTTVDTSSSIENDYVKPRLQFVSTWKDISQPHLWQAGQILYHRRYSQGCMDTWRAEIDSEDNYGADREQPLFLKALRQQYHDLLIKPSLSPPQNNSKQDNKQNKQPPKDLCHVVELPDQSRHFNMAKTGLVSGKKRNVPTILHFSHVRVKTNDAQDQRNRFVQALQLRFQTVRVNHTVTSKVAVSRENGSKHFVSRNNTLIPWDTIISPMSTHGFKEIQ